MFCSVQYGIPPATDGNYFNVNCGTAAFRDFLQERALEAVKETLEKQRDVQKKSINLLTRQINAHTRHVGNLQKRGVSPSPPAEVSDGQDPPPVNPLDSIETVNGWIEGAQAEIVQREEILTKLDEHEVQVKEITEIDLQDGESGQMINLSSFPTHMPASAVLPLRCSAVLYGLRPEQDPKSLVLELPVIERAPPVEEMIAKGLLQRKS